MSQYADRRKVVVLQRILPDYRLPVLAKLRQALPDLRVVYGHPYDGEALRNVPNSSEDWLARCRNIYFLKEPAVYITRCWGRIRPGTTVLANFELGNLNLYPLFLLRRRFDLRLVLWSFGYDPKSGFHPETRFEDRLRLFLYERADSVVFYWERGRAAVAPFLRRQKGTFVAPNTLDTDALLELRREFDALGKERIRASLGLGSRRLFVFVGRLVRDKEGDFLLRCFARARAANPAVSLIFIGGGPEEDSLRRLCRSLNLKDVQFLGPTSDQRTVGSYLYSSDALLMPGRLGLAVVHAFSFGTPVVSQSKDHDFHGEGIGYLEHMSNGLLIPNGDEKAFSEAILLLAGSPELRRRLGQEALRTVETRASVQEMVQGLLAAVAHAGR